MKKALITGIGGFVGGHLASYLSSQNIQVEGFVHPKHPKNLKARDKVRLINCDLMEKKSVFANLKNQNYDYIFHLVAFSSPAQSFRYPAQTLETNIFCQLNLLEILKQLKSKSKILIVGSSEEYGNVAAKDLPINELAPLAPVSPYAVSKVAQDLLGYQFFLNYGLNVIRVRPFNHIGPGQSTDFVVAAFASRIAQLESEGGGSLKVGNLQSFRDFTDVGDIVKAYHLALDKGEIGEVYNIGSGKAHKIAWILEKLLSFTKAKIKVIVDKSLIPPSEIKKIYCDYSKFRKQTGWQPTIDIKQSLMNTIEYERQKISQSVKS